jgi:hypothetical protein
MREARAGEMAQAFPLDLADRTSVRVAGLYAGFFRYLSNQFAMMLMSLINPAVALPSPGA